MRRRLLTIPGTPPIATDFAALENPLSYVIAAYSIVIATLVGYGLWVQRQRHKLMGRGGQPRRPGGGSAAGTGR